MTIKTLSDRLDKLVSSMKQTIKITGFNMRIQGEPRPAGSIDRGNGFWLVNDVSAKSAKATIGADENATA